MLEQSLLLIGCSNTVNQDTFGTLPVIVQYLCDLLDAMPHHWSPSTSHPTLPREAENFHSGGKYPKVCASAHILSLLATSLINNFGLIFICVKNMNVFTCDEEISKLVV